MWRNFYLPENFTPQPFNRHASFQACWWGDFFKNYMATPWFKFYGGEYLYDPKIMSLSAPERSCWITLLCYASVSEIPGEIKHLTEERILIASGIDTVDDLWNETLGFLKKFQKLEMITVDDNGMITVKNFRKRQDTALTSYERVKKFREKQRLDNADNANDNSRVEKSRSRVENIREEKKVIKESREAYKKEKAKEPEALKKMREQFGKKHSI